MIALLIKEFGFPIKIEATDIGDGCLEIFKKTVDAMNLKDIITIRNENLYTTRAIANNVDIVYTSACIEPLFSLKMLYLALNGTNCRYLLCNDQHCADIKTAQLTSSLTACVKARLLFVQAQLENDDSNAKRKRKENRWIYALDLRT